MRIYISGPITGQEDTAKDRFKIAEYILQKRYAGAEIINPCSVNAEAAHAAELTHDEYMKISFTLMDLCDAVYFMGGWEKSKGCQMEHVYAENRSMKIL